MEQVLIIIKIKRRQAKNQPQMQTITSPQWKQPLSIYPPFKTEIERASESLLNYKFGIEDLKQQLQTMHEKAEINNQDIEYNLCPQLDNLEKNLKSVIAQQKDSNAKFQNQITELKKEKVQVQNLIVGCVGKVQALEGQVGNYS